MLTEDDVIASVSGFLTSRKWTIIQARATTQHGHDIVARHQIGGHEIHIEAKGETSNRVSSHRFGRPFDSAQVRDHVANAFYAAAAMLEKTESHEGRRVGIAFPRTKRHAAAVRRIQRAIDKLELAVFWVEGDRSVTVECARPL